MKINIGRKVWLSFLIIVFLTVIGLGVSFVKSYYNSDIGKNKIYKREIKDVLNLEGNKTLIKILKEDCNNDSVDDYVVLLYRVVERKRRKSRAGN